MNNKTNKLRKYSNYTQAQRMAYKYLGKPQKYIHLIKRIKNTKFMTQRIMYG
jgi:hypothetical protein